MTPLPFTRISPFFGIAIIGLFFLVSTVNAVTYPANYSPIIAPAGGDVVHINQSYVIADQGYTPFPIWLLITFLGLFFLVLSRITTRREQNDLFAALAIIPLGASAWQSGGIDIVTSSGGGVVPGTPNTWVLLENHTIYHPEVLTIAMTILFIISIVNLYYTLIAPETIEPEPMGVKRYDQD